MLKRSPAVSCSAATLALVGAVLLAPAPAIAQLTVPDPASAGMATGDSRFVLAGDLVLADARGDLANYISSGFGGNLTGLYSVEPEKLLNLRFDLGTVTYGRESKRFRGGWEIVTTNSIDWLVLGPQLMIPRGPFRPYVNAGVGFTRFRTTSALEDRFSRETYDSRDEATDSTIGWMLGGGVYVPFGRRSPFALNVGARKHMGGEATYLREGDIVDHGDGSYTLNPQRSKTDFVVWQLGLSYRIPRGGGASSAVQ